jgi:hypothetical protein
MASLLKAQKTAAKSKRKADDMDADAGPSTEVSRKRNKQRVLLLSSRGITHRMRHLMNDLEALLPHVKKGTSVLVRVVCEGYSTYCRCQTGLEIPLAPPARARRPAQL